MSFTDRYTINFSSADGRTYNPPFLIRLLVLHLLIISPVVAQDTLAIKKVLSSIADGVIRDATFQFVDKKPGKHYTTPQSTVADSDLKPESRYNDWRYWNGVLNIAMRELGNELHDSRYTAFAKNNIAFCFDNVEYFKDRYTGKGKWDYPFGQLFTMEELDDCGAMGASTIEVYRLDRQDRYKAYIDRAAIHIETKQSRLDDGTLARPFPHKLTVWADDLYMGISFLSRMGELTGASGYFSDAALQVNNFHKYLFDEHHGLFHHCWYSDVKLPGVAFWGRANGWAMLAQVELLDRMPKEFPPRDTLLSIFQRDIEGIARCQGRDGLWHQLLDHPDSYEETSCSAMFTYAIARAVNKGYIDTSYAAIARHGWEGVTSRVRSDGQIEGVCAGTGVSDDLKFYYQRPTPLNDVHGIGAVLLAGTEILRLHK